MEKLYITNLPSFYKINLLNRINKHTNINVIFTNEKSEIRNNDFYKGEREFSFVALDSLNFFQKIILILNKINQVKQEVIICGWDQWLFWLVAMISEKKKNAVVIESSIHESSTKGWKGIIKKIFLSRISKAYCSGESQMKILKALNFKGVVVKTKGVGVFNIQPQASYVATTKVKDFVYVGRLSKEKNLEFLVETFNQLPELNLHVIGFGPLEMKLKKLAKPNISFLGAIKNSDLYDKLQNYHVLVLPSLVEPWGLVVEEAMNAGLPVIVSDKVGCAEEIVNFSNGLVFQLKEPKSIFDCIEKMTDLHYYNNLRKNISQLDFNKIAEEQVACYL